LHKTLPSSFRIHLSAWTVEGELAKNWPGIRIIGLLEAWRPLPSGMWRKRPFLLSCQDLMNMVY
jgi:hypothetical protein